MVTMLMAVRDTPAGMLRQAIASIRQQTWRDFEFLILDDGGQQLGTLAELERQAAEEPRTPCRLTRTLNRGLALANGEWIACQDADDWSEPERLKRQAFLTEHPGIALCGSNAWTHWQDGRLLCPTRLPENGKQIREALWHGNPFMHGSTMFRTEVARSLRGYREEFPCAQDHDFFWRLSDAPGAANLAEPLYHYRYHREAVSARRAAEQGCAHRSMIFARKAGRESVAGRCRGGAVPSPFAHFTGVAGARMGALLAPRAEFRPAGDPRALWNGDGAVCGMGGAVEGAGNHVSWKRSERLHVATFGGGTVVVANRSATRVAPSIT